MKTLIARAAFALVGAWALQACTMPQPQYPTSTDARAPQSQRAPVAQAEPPPPARDPHDPVASPTPPVQQQSLPPAAGPSASLGVRFTDAVYRGQAPNWGQARFSSAGRSASDGAAENRACPQFHCLPLWDARHVRVHSRIAERAERGHGRRHEAHDVVRIHKGETLKQLARRYGTTPHALARANHIHHPTDLAVGEVLRVPGADAGDAPHGRAAKTYRAGPGDTIYAIGRKFHMSPLQIMALNGFNNKTHLKRGQVVILARAEEEVARHEPRAEAVHERAELPPPRAAYTAPAPSRSERAFAATAPDHPIPYAELTGGRMPPPNTGAPVQPYTQPPARPYVAPLATQQQPQVPLAPPTADVLSAGRGRFIWPVRGQVLAGFGPTATGARNDGIEIAAADGTPVVAAAAGDVVYSGALPQLGNLVLVKHPDGWITAYAHLSRTEARIKDHVAQGQEIGQAGRSGNAPTSEVYFEIRYAPTPRDKAKPVDPTLLLAAQ